MLLCTGALLAAVSPLQAEGWRLVKDQAGIQVFLRKVPGSKYQAYRGVVRLKTDMPTLLALQEDVSGSCAWIYACREQKLLKHEDGQSWIYSRFTMPWPVRPRDAVLRVATRKGADGSVTRILSGVADYLPEQKGWVRVSMAEGYWAFIPKTAGEVEVIYQMHSEPGGNIPSWLAAGFVVDAPYYTLEALRRRVIRPVNDSGCKKGCQWQPFLVHR
ncbi:MAG: START domain-containing protein [Pseudomonas sp.]|uniref:START domain-containing protein n=1 Tax=Pseudomonas sp. TaxID=306 RepID=UPI00299EC5F3|nr:START domain-containing protein [Pseudomonas sp.]MDX1722470.1 START domain-containing protein [Pseudomonas sp.]